MNVTVYVVHEPRNDVFYCLSKQRKWDKRSKHSICVIQNRLYSVKSKVCVITVMFTADATIGKRIIIRHNRR